MKLIKMFFLEGESPTLTFIIDMFVWTIISSAIITLNEQNDFGTLANSKEKWCLIALIPIMSF